MKTLFARFWRRNLGCAKLAILAQLEYRFNFFTDAVIQPTLVGAIEVAIWSAIIGSTGNDSLAGFPKASYLAYALWAAFFARIGANWMYEFRMVEEIESGTVNSVLSRPISFYEYYLSQFLGYKVISTIASLLVPIAITLAIPGPTMLWRLPLAIATQLLYLMLVHTISFSVASIGFFLNRSYAFSVAKNVGITMLTGELFPLDLVPEPYRGWVMWLPFSNSVYVPVGYLTGRLQADAVVRGMASTLMGLVVFGLFAKTIWGLGSRRYSGTGA